MRYCHRHRLVDAEAFEGAQRAGELDVDVRAEAAALVAFVDGLCLHHAATTSFDAASSRAALRAYVDRLSAEEGKDDARARAGADRAQPA
jgi:hypothetical protein